MPRTTTARPSPKAVVLARETARLAAYLRLRQPIDAALEAGRVRKTKIAEFWLYHPSAIRRAVLLDAAATETDRLLARWLVVPLGVMAGMVSASIEPTCSKGAARALLHHLVSTGAVDRLGLLTAQDEPHLAIYRPFDAKEVTRQLQHIRAALATGREIRHSQLPDPVMPRDGQAWAETLINHAEFGGWGRRAAGRLQAWPRP